MYDSADGVGHYEMTNIEEKLGGEECDEGGEAGILGGQKKPSLKMDSPKVVKPEDLYAQPAKEMEYKERQPSHWY